MFYFWLIFPSIFLIAAMLLKNNYVNFAVLIAYFIVFACYRNAFVFVEDYRPRNFFISFVSPILFTCVLMYIKEKTVFKVILAVVIMLNFWFLLSFFHFL